MSPRLLSLPILSWALYDLANTIFSYAIVTRYFNDWMINDQKLPDWSIGLMTQSVALVLLLTLPLFGALADELGRRKIFLISFTLVSVGATAALSLVSAPALAFVVCGLAIWGFNSALAHYDPLLAHVAVPQRRAAASALGVGLGYLGVMLSTLVIFPQLVPDGDSQAAFLPTAVLFLVFSLPCFLFVRERRRTAPEPATPAATPGLLRRAVGDTRQALVQARRYRYGRFLLARFFYTDAIATVIAYMTIYAKRVGDFSDAKVDRLLAVSIVFALVGAFLSSQIAARSGPKRALVLAIALAVVALVAGAASTATPTLWVLGALIGTVFGALNTSDRLLLVALVPEARRGEAFSLFALVGKVSAGIGPLLLWGGTIFILHDRLGLVSLVGATRLALVMLALAAAVGALLLVGVETRRPGDDE